mgnify:FL=1
MITIKSKEEIALMKKAGEIVYLTHQTLIPYIKEGITTKQLDEIAEKFILSMNATPSFKNYNGYPTSICTSINEEVVHGIPSNRKLKNGDIISIDIGACYKGYHGDSAWSYKVGEISSEKAYLLKHTELALYEGLKQVKPGNYLNDIGTAIEKYAKAHHLGVVRELVGHGVGTHLHEDPDVPNYNIKKKGPLLKEGMTIAIEPMLNLGTHKVFVLDDDWTIVTGDNKPSAHFEHTVAVTKDGYEILTKKG